MQEIKKCPFCGGDGELTQRYNSRYDNYFVFVACSLCSAQSKTFTSDDNAERVEWQSKACEKAVNAWNMNYKGER